jgi:hypothetical protein
MMTVTFVGMVLAFPSLLGPLLVIVPLARRVPFERRGPSYWFSSSMQILSAFLVLWFWSLMISELIDWRLINTGSARLDLHADILLVALMLLGLITLVVASAKMRPRARAVGRAAVRLALLAGGMLVVSLPLLLTEAHRNPDDSGDNMLLILLPLSGLLQCITMLCMCLFLLKRDAVLHTWHCRSCGYELSGLDSDTCPECGLAIDASQLLALGAAVAEQGLHVVKGSHAGVSSPTSSR